MNINNIKNKKVQGALWEVTSQDISYLSVDDIQENFNILLNACIKADKFDDINNRYNALKKIIEMLKNSLGLKIIKTTSQDKYALHVLSQDGEYTYAMTKFLTDGEINTLIKANNALKDDLIFYIKK